MSYSKNYVHLVGTLGRDAETKPAGSGTVTKFSLATERSYKKDGEWTKETTWHNVTLWNNERLADHLLKGTKAAVYGRISIREYEKDGSKRQAIEIVAEDVIALGRTERTERGERPPRTDPGGYASDYASGGIDDSDVPF